MPSFYAYAPVTCVCVSLVCVSQDANTLSMLLTACAKLQMHDHLFAHLETMRTLSLMPAANTISHLLTTYSGDRVALERALRQLQDAAASPSAPPP